MEAWASTVLVAIRFWAIMRVQASWRQLLGPLWGVVAPAFALVLALGLASPGSTSSLPAEAWLTAGVSEFLLGSIIGLFAALPAYALIGAGGSLAVLTRVPPGPIVGLTVAIALSSALHLRLHHAVLSTMVGLLEVFPLAQPQRWVDQVSGEGLRMLVFAGSATTTLAVALATPVLLAAAVSELALGLVARGPSLSGLVVDGLRPCVRVAAALLALGASWAAYEHVWAAAVTPWP